MPTKWILVLLFANGVGLIIAANFVAYVMLGEVNGRRPPGQQYSMLFYDVRFFEVWGEHKRIYPASRRRLHLVLCFLAGLFLCVTALGIAVFS